MISSSSKESSQKLIITSPSIIGKSFGPFNNLTCISYYKNGQIRNICHNFDTEIDAIQFCERVNLSEFSHILYPDGKSLPLQEVKRMLKLKQL